MDTLKESLEKSDAVLGRDKRVGSDAAMPIVLLDFCASELEHINIQNKSKRTIILYSLINIIFVFI